jgi:prepilin-type N-terminal cleavage/methylation domain-containing protein
VDDGFTIIEVLIAALAMAVIVGATAALFASGNSSSLASQRQSQLLAVADQQIEKIRQAVKTNASGFSALAMSSAPAAGTASTLPYSATTFTDPNHFVTTKASCGLSGAEFTIEANYNDTSEGTATGNEPPFAGCDAGTEPLIEQTGGIVTPTQASVTVGTETATVNSYVTATNLGCNTTLGTGNCTNDARRVIVAVKFDGSSGVYNSGPNAPVYVSTIFTNPIPSNAPNSSIGITLGLGIG